MLLLVIILVVVLVAYLLLRCGEMMLVMWSTVPVSPAGDTLDHNELPTLQNGTRLPVAPPCRKTPQPNVSFKREWVKKWMKCPCSKWLIEWLSVSGCAVQTHSLVLI